MKSWISIVSFCTIAAALSGHAAAQDAPNAAATASALDAGRIDAIVMKARVAAGGKRLEAYAALSESGTFEQAGGPPSAFNGVTDLRNGYSRVEVTVGPATIVQGYDGTEWTLANGALSIVSLPSMVADAVTQAYLGASAYLKPAERHTIVAGHVETIDGRRAYVLHVEPSNGSPADLAFDASTYRLVQVVAHTAQGTDTTTMSQFETFDGVPTAMRAVDVNSSGTTSTFTLSSVHYTATVDSHMLARPAYVSHGELASPVTVPFVSDVAGSAGHIVVPVLLDGKAASLDFDSGGENFLIPQAAQRLGLQTSGGIATGGVGAGQQMTSYAAVSTVDFGGARLSHQNFAVTGLPYAFAHPRKGVAPEGLIGFEYLANFRVTVRYAQGQMELAPFDSSAPAGGVTLPFKSDGQHAYVEATIDGATGYFLLDTGNSGGIILNEPFVEEHHLFEQGGLQYAAPGGVGGGFAVKLTAAKTFSLAGIAFHDVPVGIPQVKSGSFATRGVAGNLGAGALSRFDVTFDFKAQTVTFTPNAKVAEKPRTDRIGLSLNQTAPDAFEIQNVVPASPAADAGIVAGDRIVAVAGTLVSSGLGLGDLPPYTGGGAAFTVTVVHGTASKTVTLTPRDLIPPAQ